MCELILIRHGETNWNLEKRYQGQVDIPLNDTGREQAQALSHELSSLPISAIYSSHLQRALETAQILNNHHNHTIETFESLQEGHYGSFEGKLVADVRNEHKETFVHMKTLSLEEQFDYRANPTHETYREVLTRVLQTLKTLANKHQETETILIVSHGAVIRAILSHCGHTDGLHAPVPNCKAISIKHRDGQFFLVSTL